MRNFRQYEPSTENPDIVALAERTRGTNEPRITSISKARQLAEKRAKDFEQSIDICWDSDEGSYKLRPSYKGNRGVVETVR